MSNGLGRLWPVKCATLCPADFYHPIPLGAVPGSQETVPLVSGSISKAAIINAKPLKVKVAIAAAKPNRAARMPTNAGNTAPMSRPAL
jgi:hypothetical protein